jgi:hypothetical protein
VGEIKKDVERIKENFEGKVKEMEVKFKGLKTGLSGKLETSLVKLKPPPFDGTTSWSMYKKQFEAAAGANNWDDEGKAVALTLALRGRQCRYYRPCPWKIKRIMRHSPKR